MNAHACFAPSWFVLASSACSLLAQSITLVPPPGPVAPGATLVLAAINTSGSTLLSDGSPMRLLLGDGELASDALVGCGGVGEVWGPGGTGNFSFFVPASGRGSAGSFVLRLGLRSLAGGEAVGVARIDVGAPTPAFPAIHMLPAGVRRNGTSHWVNPAEAEQWEIASTGAQPHTFGAGDTVDVLLPGGIVPQARLQLAGITVASGGAARIALPLGGLPDGPWSVRATWSDPAAGLRVVEHGIVVGSEPLVDLQLPDGHRVPAGGGIAARLVVDGITFPTPGEPPQPFAAGLCLLPGSTPLGAVQVPLAFDPVLSGSLANGLGGVLQNHIGMTAVVQVFCAHRTWPYRVVEGIALRHPNVPAVAGLRLRMAAATFDFTRARFLASQPEWVTFQ
jgi:hypothetical protein